MSAGLGRKGKGARWAEGMLKEKSRKTEQENNRRHGAGRRTGRTLQSHLLGGIRSTTRTGSCKPPAGAPKWLSAVEVLKKRTRE